MAVSSEETAEVGREGGERGREGGMAFCWGSRELKYCNIGILAVWDFDFLGISLVLFSLHSERH